MQRFAVISIFEKLRSAPPHLNADSNPGRDAIAHCLNSNSSPVVDQSVRELSRLVIEGTVDPSRGLLDLQSVLEGCDSRFVDVFVKGIGFIVRFAFGNGNWFRGFESTETHPFVKVLSTRIEVESELVQQVLLFVVQSKKLGSFVEVCDFLRPFLNFVILRTPSKASSALFAKRLVSSIASLSCSFASEAMPILKLMMQCLKYLPCKNAEDFKDIVYFAEIMVDAYTVVLREVVATRMPAAEAQLFGVELLDSLLSCCTNFGKHGSRKEPIIKLSKQLLLVQKELGLLYQPELSSILTSLFIILTRAEFEHEQLSALKLSNFLLKWKSETERAIGRSTFGLFGEFLLILPLINLLSSPSKSVKAIATDLLSLLENLLLDLLAARKEIQTIQENPLSLGKLENITYRLLQHLWFQDLPSASSFPFLSVASKGENKTTEKDIKIKSWLSQLREYCLIIAKRQKSELVPQSKENLQTELPLLLSSVVAVLVMHRSLGSYAVDTLAAISVMDPKVGLTLLLTTLFYKRIFCNKESFHALLLKLLEMLPSLASYPAMVPLIVQTILPMLNNDAKPVLRATAIRLLCKTWEVTDRVFKNLQVILHPKAFDEFKYDKNTCTSMAASVRDICRKNPDRGVDLILSVSACIESRDLAVHALGLHSLGHLCEADVVDFYTAWDVIAKDVLDYSMNPIVAQGICALLKWGAMDAEAYPEYSKSVLQILWDVGTSPLSGNAFTWIKARTSAFESLKQYEVEHIQQSIPDFKKRSVDLLLSEDNPDVLRAMEEFGVKIITFEHITRRRWTKEKRVTVNKIEKLLDVFSDVTFSSGKWSSITRVFPGAALLCLSFIPKEVNGQGKSKELPKLHAAYENALVEIAESLQLSRNILLALLSLQSWKPFMQRWLKASVAVLDRTVSSDISDKSSKAANSILEIMVRIAEESIPRCAENIALAIGSLCMVLPPSAHAVTTTAAKFLLDWLYQFEHEHRQWSVATALGLVVSHLHATDHRQKYQIINGLLTVACSSKSTLVKGACGAALGLACQGLLTSVEGADGSDFASSNRIKENNLLGRIIRALCLAILQLSPSSFGSLESICKYFPSDTDDAFTDATSDFCFNGGSNLEEDVWGVVGLILGLGNSVNTIYLAGAPEAVTMIKALVTSWIPHVNALAQHSSVCDAKSDILFSVGSCLALPMVVAFCLGVELVDDDELNHLVNGYRELISDLLSVKKSGIHHQSLLMAACVGAGNLLSCILDEGVNSLKAEDVKCLLELFRKAYTNPNAPIVHFGGMLGVVNALGAGAGIFTHIKSKPSHLQNRFGQKESAYIRGPILSTPACEPLLTSLIQEMFLVAQEPKDPQLQNYAAWAVSFLKHRWWSEELVKGRSQSNEADSTIVSSFPEDSMVWQLCLWLMNLNGPEVDKATHVYNIATVLRCLSRAPRLPSLEWGAIIRRSMRFEHQIYGRISDQVPGKGVIREECIKFALLHANHVNSLLLFLDELYELSRFRTLELNIQKLLLSHLGDLIKVFSVSRLEKLFDDMAEYFSSPDSLYQVYNNDQKCLLQLSFWKGLCQSLDEASAEFSEYMENIEKCMELLFALLPALHFDSSFKMDQANLTDEWSAAVKCVGKARQNWTMGLLEVPVIAHDLGESQIIEVVKKIQVRAKLVMTGCIPFTELAKLKSTVLNTKANGIWDALVDVVTALQDAEDSVKRQWLADAVEISCIATYPCTAMQFVGLLCSSCCEYMPLLIMDQVRVLRDLPVTLPSLLSDSRWIVIAEALVLNLWRSTERIYNWITATGNDAPMSQSIDRSEASMASFLVRVMHQTCVSLKEYLPLEKQLKLASIAFP